MAKRKTIKKKKVLKKKVPKKKVVKKKSLKKKRVPSITPSKIPFEKRKYYTKGELKILLGTAQLKIALKTTLKRPIVIIGPTYLVSALVGELALMVREKTGADTLAEAHKEEKGDIIKYYISFRKK